MAYKFKNMPTATATIERYAGSATGDTFKLAGINGEQTNADNFKTAIADFVGIGGIQIASGNKALQRNINQFVDTDDTGLDPEFSLNPNSFSVEDYTSVVIAQIGVTEDAELDISNLTYSGQIPAGVKISVNASEYQLRFESGRQESGYTTGSDTATLTVTLPAQTVDGKQYKSATATITFTDGVSSEFETIS